MTKQEYRRARRMYRDNGAYALKWLKGEAFMCMDRLHNQSEDLLQERAWIVAKCKRDNVRFTFLNLANLKSFF